MKGDIDIGIGIGGWGGNHEGFCVVNEQDVHIVVTW